jgi:hypothetical protein
MERPDITDREYLPIFSNSSPVASTLPGAITWPTSGCAVRSGNAETSQFAAGQRNGI